MGKSISIPKWLSVRSPPILFDPVHHSEPGRLISLENAQYKNIKNIIIWQELQFKRIINLLLGVGIPESFPSI